MFFGESVPCRFGVLGAEGAGDGTSTIRDIRREARSSDVMADELDDRTSGGKSSEPDSRGDCMPEEPVLTALVNSTPDCRRLFSPERVELRALFGPFSNKLPPDGMGGTGGTIDESGVNTMSPPLILLSRQYGEFKNGFSPLGSVAESCRTPDKLTPLRYLDARKSLERMKEFAISARASVVPERADILSADVGDSGRECACEWPVGGRDVEAVL